MLSLILFLNSISRPSYGFDIIHAQLFADVLDVGVHDFLIAKVVIAPNTVQQALPCKYPPLVLHQEFQYLEFPDGQGHAFVFDKDREAVRIQGEILITEEDVYKRQGVDTLDVHPVFVSIHAGLRAF